MGEETRMTYYKMRRQQNNLKPKDDIIRKNKFQLLRQHSKRTFRIIQKQCILNLKITKFSVQISGMERILGCLFYQSLKFYNNIFLLVCLTIILIGWYIKLSAQTSQPLSVIYRWVKFVHNQWGCKSIYRPLSYPFRSLSNL